MSLLCKCTLLCTSSIGCWPKGKRFKAQHHQAVAIRPMYYPCNEQVLLRRSEPMLWLQLPNKLGSARINFSVIPLHCIKYVTNKARTTCFPPNAGLATICLEELRKFTSFKQVLTSSCGYFKTTNNFVVIFLSFPALWQCPLLSNSIDCVLSNSIFIIDLSAVSIETARFWLKVLPDMSQSLTLFQIKVNWVSSIYTTHCTVH